MQPNPQNETVYYENLSKLHTTQQWLRDAQNCDKPSKRIKHIPRNSKQASSTADLGFSPQLLLTYSALSPRGAIFHRRPVRWVDRTRLRNSLSPPPLLQQERCCSPMPEKCPSMPQQKRDKLQHQCELIQVRHGYLQPCLNQVAPGSKVHELIAENTRLKMKLYY